MRSLSSLSPKKNRFILPPIPTGLLAVSEGVASEMFEEPAVRNGSSAWPGVPSPGA